MMDFFVNNKKFFFILIIGLIGSAIYANTLHVPYFLDDTPNIRDNHHIRLIHLSLKGLLEAGFESPLSSRPVANISFALNYYLGGSSLFGYHLVNILIHIITGLLLFLLFNTTLRLYWRPLPGVANLRIPTVSWAPDHWFRRLDPMLVSFGATILWLVHPVQTQSVTYIVQRMNSMAAMFYLLCILLYARGRISQKQRTHNAEATSTHPYILFAGSLIAGLLALGTKEIAATIPFFILLYELYFFQNLSWSWVTRNYLYVGIVLVLFFITAAIYMGNHPWDKILAGYAGRDFTLEQRVLTEFRVVIFYLSLLIFPHPSRLNLEHDYALSHSLLDPATTILSLGFILVLLGISIYLAKKDRILSFCILWFLGNLVIESSVIGLEIIFEHRLYLPSMFLILAAVILIYRYLQPKRLQVMILSTVVIVFAFWTFERNKVWQDEVIFFSDCVQKSPNKARPRNALGGALFDQGKVEEAIAQYTDSLQLDPDYASAHYNLGIALAETGNSTEAIKHYNEALRLNPKETSVLTNLGIELYAAGKIGEAMEHYSKALLVDPYFVNAHIHLAIALAGLGKNSEAIDHYSEALRINPVSTEAHINLGNILLKEGKIKEALWHYSKVLEINPKNALAYNNLGTIVFQMGNYDQAIVLFKEALNINPDFLNAQNNLKSASQAKMASVASTTGMDKK